MFQMLPRANTLSRYVRFLPTKRSVSSLGKSSRRGDSGSANERNSASWLAALTNAIWPCASRVAAWSGGRAAAMPRSWASCVAATASRGTSRASSSWARPISWFRRDKSTVADCGSRSGSAPICRQSLSIRAASAGEGSGKSDAISSVFATIGSFSKAAFRARSSSREEQTLTPNHTLSSSRVKTCRSISALSRCLGCRLSRLWSYRSLVLPAATAAATTSVSPMVSRGQRIGNSNQRLAGKMPGRRTSGQRRSTSTISGGKTMTVESTHSRMPPPATSPNSRMPMKSVMAAMKKAAAVVTPPVTTPGPTSTAILKRAVSSSQPRRRKLRYVAT